MENLFIAFLVVAIPGAIYFLIRNLQEEISAEFYYSGKTPLELKAKYGRFELTQTLLFISISLFLAIILYFLLSWMSNFRFDFIKDLFVIVPRKKTLLYASGLSGFAIGSRVSLTLAKKIQGKDWEEFMAYFIQRYKVNYLLIAGRLSKIILVIAAGLWLLFLDSYSSFGKTEIRINRFAGLGATVYAYSDVLEIHEFRKRMNPDRTVEDIPYFLLYFSDGKNWSSLHSGFGDFKMDKTVIEFVAEKTGKTPTVSLYGTE